MKNKGHLDTGMLGTHFLLQSLREMGRNDLAFSIANQQDYPGWGYLLAQGMTTFGEQWDGILVPDPRLLPQPRRLVLSGPGRHPARCIRPRLQADPHQARHRR